MGPIVTKDLTADDARRIAKETCERRHQIWIIEIKEDVRNAAYDGRYQHTVENLTGEELRELEKIFNDLGYKTIYRRTEKKCSYSGLYELTISWW